MSVLIDETLMLIIKGVALWMINGEYNTQTLWGAMAQIIITKSVSRTNITRLNNGFKELEIATSFKQ